MRPWAERTKRAFRLVHKPVTLCFRRIEPEPFDERGFATGLILARRLAHRHRISFDIQNIVGDLERCTDCLAIGPLRLTIGNTGVGHNRTGFCRECDQRAGLHRLQ